MTPGEPREPITGHTRKILSVFGTRPEAIKMAPVVLALARLRGEGIESRVCVTAQHRELLDPVLELFGIRPDHDLGVMAPAQDLYDVTSRALLGLREVLRAEAPDRVLVHGDTTTSLAGALAAFYAEIQVGHVEAGLRTGDLAAPFPEELNRTVVDRIADLHFAPTEGARKNLLREGLPQAGIHVTGNTVIDALVWARERVEREPAARWSRELGPALEERLAERAGERLVLITGHRRESFGQGFRDFCAALRELARAHPEWILVWPLHRNPNARAPAQDELSGLPNVHLIEALDYAPFVWLMARCDLVVTDSGGVQEEAPALGKPVLVTREKTERPEAVHAGGVKLVGTDRRAIVREVERVLGDAAVYRAMASARSPYGDGHAAERIARVLREA